MRASAPIVTIAVIEPRSSSSSTGRTCVGSAPASRSWRGRSSRPEKLWRWCRREPALALLAVSLVVGLIGVTTQWWRAESHLRDAVEQSRLAEASELRQLEANRALIQAKDRETTARRPRRGDSMRR